MNGIERVGVNIRVHWSLLCFVSISVRHTSGDQTSDTGVLTAETDLWVDILIVNMVSFPAEILLGIYLGLLVGILPAIVVWGIGFAFKYTTATTVSAPVALLLSLGLAAGNGWVLRLVNQPILDDLTLARIATAAVVVAVLALYAHSSGDRMATEFPHRLSLSELRDKTLSREGAKFINDGTEVRIQVIGEVADMDGYPPLPEELRAKLRNTELTLPGDLRVHELERRVEDRIQTEYDLGSVSVSIDEKGRATVVAAPPFSGLSKRVAHDRHAVSVTGLIPTGLARGDEVTVITPNAQVRGTVVSAQTDDSEETDDPEIAPLSNDRPTGNADRSEPVQTKTTSGGEGRLTVAVTRTDVKPLLSASETKVVVEPRGPRREYEVVSMLRRADNQFRRFVVGSNSPLSGTRLGSARLQETHGVSVLAVQKEDGWHVAPDIDTTLTAGDELFAVGVRDALEAFESTGLDGGEHSL